MADPNFPDDFKLNPIQRQIIESPLNLKLFVSGPYGTGKTTAGVERMRYLLAQGFTRFIELGPGTTLSGFMKRIDKNARMFNVADLRSLEETAKGLVS